MSGYYNYHPTIEKPGTFKVQTASQQAPFYFGGSQVPLSLGLDNHIYGEGIGKKKYISKMIYKPKTNLLK